MMRLGMMITKALISTITSKREIYKQNGTRVQMHISDAEIGIHSVYTQSTDHKRRETGLKEIH